MTFPDVQDKVMRLVVTHLPRSILQADKEGKRVESSVYNQEQELQEEPRHSQQSLLQQELDEERREAEHLRVEQHREHQHHSEVYQRVHAQWIQAIQPVLILPPPFEFPQAAMHQAMLESLQLRSPNESSHDNNALSPRVLTKMSQVCYCVHRLTRIELFTTSIHEEYRTLVNWMHGTIQETETIRQLVDAKVQALQEQRVQAQQAHQAKLQQLQYKHLEQKIVLLKLRLEERKRWVVGKPTATTTTACVHTSPDGTIKTVSTDVSSPNSDIATTMTVMTGMDLLLADDSRSDTTTDSESMHSVDLDLGDWDDDEGGQALKAAGTRSGNNGALVPPFLRHLLPVQLFGKSR